MPRLNSRKLTMQKTTKVFPDGVTPTVLHKGVTYEEGDIGVTDGMYDILINDGSATEGDAAAAKKAADDAAALRAETMVGADGKLPPMGLTNQEATHQEAEALKDAVDEQERIRKEDAKPHKPGPKEVK